MAFDKHISESAFLVNESRARNIELSRDRYARLWVTDSTRKLWDDFTREVYPYDDIELGLRNRFFLERLNIFIDTNQDVVFVNIGSGFTSYPFLTDKRCRCIEVDYAHVIDYKRRKLATWQADGLLPERKIEFLPANLANESDVEDLSNYLGLLLANNSSFILLEGLTYYLEKKVLQRIFNMFSRIQERDSVLTFDYWRPDVIEHPIFLRFRDFFSRRLGYDEKHYTLFDDDFLQSLPGYEIVEITDIQELETIYSKTTFLADYQKILPEHYAVLRKEA